jgi:hypothetical protein
VGGHAPEYETGPNEQNEKSKSTIKQLFNPSKLGGHAPESDVFHMLEEPLGGYAPESRKNQLLFYCDLNFFIRFWVDICRNGALFWLFFDPKITGIVGGYPPDYLLYEPECT